MVNIKSSQLQNPALERSWVGPGRSRLARTLRGIGALFWSRRVRWGFTSLGHCTMLAAATLLVSVWWLAGERLLAETDRVPAKVLVVESWIGTRALSAAAAEYRQGHYRRMLLTGGYASDCWSTQRGNYGEMARAEMLGNGIPESALLVAPATDVESQRTHMAAVTAWQTLTAAGEAASVNVFTVGAHARRSRLVFAKAGPSGAIVGVIGWLPPAYGAEPWWKSSERADDLLKETAAYAFELTLNSGRWGGTLSPR